MKKIFLILTSASFLLMIGCKKEGGINGDVAELGTGSYVTRVAVGGTTIDYSNLATSKVDVTVKEYGTPVDKIKIWVSKGAASTNKASWKAIKEVPMAGDTKLEVTANEIATALGIPVTGLETGATYTLYNQVISKDGQVHDITNMNSAMYGSPNYSALMTWAATVVCPFTGNMAGNYRVVADDWLDWSPGDIVPVTDGPGANQVNLTQVWPNPIYGSPVSPFVVSVAPATGVATIASGVTIGNYTCCGYTAVTGTGSTGFVFSCTGEIKVRVRLSAPPFGDQGFFNLTLRKI
jgi:hypothetical protein